MHCNGFSARLQIVLSGKTGVQSVEVSFAQKQASLEYDSALITVDQLQQAVEKSVLRLQQLKFKGLMNSKGFLVISVMAGITMLAQGY